MIHASVGGIHCQSQCSAYAFIINMDQMTKNQHWSQTDQLHAFCYTWQINHTGKAIPKDKVLETDMYPCKTHHSHHLPPPNILGSVLLGCKKAISNSKKKKKKFRSCISLTYKPTLFPLSQGTKTCRSNYFVFQITIHPSSPRLQGVCLLNLAEII